MLTKTVYMKRQVIENMSPVFHLYLTILLIIEWLFI